MGASAQTLTAGRGESPAGDILLCAKNIKKVYGGAVALADGNLTVRSGEIHALLGENGAGKSTLIKCLAGTPPPDAGEIQVGGVTLPIAHSAWHATDAGLAFIHQETTLIENHRRKEARGEYDRLQSLEFLRPCPTDPKLRE